MTQHEKQLALKNMETWGSSFESAIATAWLCADRENEEKLFSQFEYLLKRHHHYVQFSTTQDGDR